MAHAFSSNLTDIAAGERDSNLVNPMTGFLGHLFPGSAKAKAAAQLQDQLVPQPEWTTDVWTQEDQTSSGAHTTGSQKPHK